MSGRTALVLRVVDGPDQGRQVLVAPTATVGRGKTDLVLSTSRTSRDHARVSDLGGHAELIDLNSRHGTWIGDDRIGLPRQLRPGERFRVDADTILLLAADRPLDVPVLPAAQLVVSAPGSSSFRYPLSGQRVRIGRDPAQCDLALPVDPTVSAVHCEIIPTVGQLVLRDLGAARGIVLNDALVDGEAPLTVGDRVTIGRTELTVASAAGTIPPTPPPLDLLVREEGGSRTWAVTVTAGPGAIVTDVAAAFATYLGLGLPSTRSDAAKFGWCLYRERGSRLLSADSPWVSADVRRADTLILGPLTDQPDPGPRWSSRAPARPAEWRTRLRGLPRSPLTLNPHRLDLPAAPAPMSWRGRGLLWQIGGGLGMVAVGVGMAFVNPAFLLFAVLGGVAALWGILAGLLGERARAKIAVANLRTRLAALDTELAKVRDQQAAVLQEALPRAAALAVWPETGNRALWQRRSRDQDFLALRLGVGTRPALLDVDAAFGLRSPSSSSPLTSEVTALLDRHRDLLGAPIATPTPAAGVLGLTGEAGPATALARALVVQAAALHAPTELPIGVLASDEAEAWTRWLPHVEAAEGPRAAYRSDDAEALAARLIPSLASDRHSSGHTPPRMLLLVDAAAAALPRVRALLEAAASGTALALVLGPRDALPVATTLLVECRGERARLLGESAQPAPFTAEGLNCDEATRFATALAPYADTDPTQVRTGRTSAAPGTDLLTLLGVASPTDADPTTLWAGEPPVPAGSPIGVTDTGEVLGLSMLDGPHGLIAGTTGSGKSELLQTFLAGLAATHSPTAVNFFLVDFKGGATFTEINRLPHVVGTVSNLEGALAERAVTSLKAELIRRQEVLASARVKEFPDYRPDPTEGLPPLPRLLLVIDEFAMLANELPDVMDRFVDIATVGRSLGVHMLLATQSPSGVVSGKVEANTSLRICLRVALAQESIDVLGRKEAADIPRDKPGRGYLRYGGETELTGFQTARVAGPFRPSGPSTPVQVVPFADARPPAVRRVGAGSLSAATRTVLDVLTETLAQRAAALGLGAPRALWLPPLPEVISADALPPLPDLTQTQGPQRRPIRSASGVDLRFRLGLADEPQQVAQPVLAVDLADEGHLLVVGAYGAGKTNALRHAAAELASRLAPDSLHLYGIDAGDGSLAPLLDLPQTGDVVGADDLERLLRLVARLERLVSERRTTAALDSPHHHASPALVLLVDDFAAFKEASDGFQYGVLLDRLISLIRSGPTVGLHVILAASQRADMPSTLFNLLPRKAMLRQADPLDYDLIGLPAGQRPAASPAGRSMVSGPPPRELQIPLSERDAFSRLAAAWPPGSWQPESGPLRVRRLPTEVTLAEVLSGPVVPPLAPGQFLLGVGGAEADPVHYDFDRHGPHLLVAGPERSGRSTVLAAAAAGLRAGQPDLPLTIVAARRSPLHSLAGQAGITVATALDEVATGIAELAARPAGAKGGLLVDDLDAVGDSATMALEPLLRGARESGLVSVIAGRTADLTRSYDPTTRYLRSLRSTLLLLPRPEDGELIGVRIPPSLGAQVPGRALLCVGDGQPVPLQVARSDVV